MPDKDILRMKELAELLTGASRAYYAEDTEIMSNLEYDALYDELKALEEKTGVVLEGSPTEKVGFESVDFLPKEQHEKPMLSLDKTKSREELASWLSGHQGLLSWKLDGLTVVLTYLDGKLQKAVTRGNGEVGEVITPNARVFENLPSVIPYQGLLILRGEAVIRYSDFERINRELEEEALRKGEIQEVRYKNPRNLCSGSVRQLNSRVTAGRHVRFYAFSLVEADEADFHDSREEQFLFLQKQGFETVEYRKVDPDTVEQAVEYFEHRVASYDLPSDGLVLLLNEIGYGESLGLTAKFPRNAIAFKWADEQQETVLEEVEWSASRTGLINPVAIFAPVELEGTTVRRASVHNISILRALKLGIGDRILVYKANMIIPQIAENLTGSDTLEIPASCPVCGGKTEIRQEKDTEVLVCTNPACPAKKLKSFALFVSRNAMNIEGFSEMTLEKFIAAGLLHEFADIYHLGEHGDTISRMEGFGVKSFEKLIASIDRSRTAPEERILAGIGIPGIGSSGARTLCRTFPGGLEGIRKASAEELSAADGIGVILAEQIASFFADPEKAGQLDRLLAELQPEQIGGTDAEAALLAGKVFVITGSVEKFKNRDEMKAYIDRLGGKVTGSVTSRTDYLINNDISSASSKNKKAGELGIPILSEQDLLDMTGGKGQDGV